MQLPKLRTATAYVAILSAIGCGDSSLARSTAPSAVAGDVTTPEVMPCYPEYEATCYSDQQLETAVARFGGAVFIGVAPVGYPQPFAAIRTNLIPRWDSLAFEQQIRDLNALGVQTDERFRWIAVVAAHVTPAVAVQVRRLPTTWFIEPQFPLEQRWGGNPATVAGLVKPATLVRALITTEAFPDLTTQQRRDWGVTSIGAPDAWAMGFHGEGMDAGVLDGEPLAAHPDLQAGPPDNRVAIRAIGQFTDEPFGSPNGHATWVVGAIVARDNSFGTVGGAPYARVLHAKVCTATGCPLAGTIDALHWMAINPEIDVVNMSLGGANGQCTLTGHLAAKEIVDSGKVIVTAGGEGGTPVRDQSPWGCYDEADEDGPYDPPGIAGLINVSAHDIRGEPATYTWFDDPGKDMSVGGPGGDDQDGFSDENPYSTFVAGQVLSTTCGDFSGDGYGPCIGTSMAAPYASAVVLLIRQKFPSYTPAQVESAIEQNVTPWPCTARQPCGSGSPPYTWFGTGRVSVSKIFAPPPPSVTINGPDWIDTPGTYTWTANPSGGNGTYTYRWEAKDWNTSTWYFLGSSQNQSRSVTSSTRDFWIRVTVTSGAQTASSTKFVDNLLWDPPCNPGDMC